MRPRLLWLGAALVLAFGVIQLVPYGRNHTNPPITQEPAWDRPETRALAARACFDCHSDSTVWPWYSNVAPVSWLVQHDVDDGRRKLNFSQWDRPQKEAHDTARATRNKTMPPWYYSPLHSTTARLTAAERSTLVAGLETTFGSERSRSAKTP